MLLGIDSVILVSNFDAHEGEQTPVLGMCAWLLVNIAASTLGSQLWLYWAFEKLACQTC
jgi:hypothetical protein